MAISTDSLKSLISDPVHPVPLSDVHLDSSPEIEMVQSENETNLEDIGKKDREIIQKSIKTSPEKNKTSKEELEEGEDDSEEEEGQIEKGKTSVKTNSSSILYITNLVRPFTIMQLKGLLARTGKIVDNGFWIDRIKSKCYVKFENEDEAIETRHALHGVRWPTSNPKCLNVEFGTEEALATVLLSMDGPKAGIENSKENRLIGIGWDGNGFEEERKVVRQVREWDMGKREEFPKERIRDRIQDDRKEQKDDKDKKNPFKEGEKEEERRGRDRRHRSPSFEKRRRSRIHKMKKDNEPPLRLLDDLFRKTKAVPCVYWLPLTPEQILEKEQRRLKRVQEVEEHRRERESVKKNVKGNEN
uniref:RRM domain-containing protein n=1 Tax=Megaselia scalaris TaxID=36166 RepID=T1GPJ7_MEGSC